MVNFIVMWINPKLQGVKVDVVDTKWRKFIKGGLEITLQYLKLS